MEYLILRAFELDGAEVGWPYNVPLADVPGERTTVEQVDGLVWLDGLCFMIESKNAADRINFDPIAKLRSRLSRRPAPMVGLIFSRLGFTEVAKTMTRFTSPQTVLLWEGAELDFALSAAGEMVKALRLKYRMAMKYAIPDYNITAGTLVP
jgi:hypothetical protein